MTSSEKRAKKGPEEAQAVTALPLEVPLKGLTPTERVHVVVVGAGGTGGRVLLLLPRLLRAGDVVSIVDPDVVEMKNLARQHFHPTDIGRPKVDVAAERFAAVAPEGVTVIPHQGLFHTVWGQVRATAAQQVRDVPLALPGGAGNFPADLSYVILIGAVDNRKARQQLFTTMTGVGARSAWIDAGNDFRTGQVCLNLQGWPLEKIPLALAGQEEPRRHPWMMDHTGQTLIVPYGVTLSGSRLTFPDTLDSTLDEKDAALSCAGFDLQSVGANALAATYACNMLRWLLDGEVIGTMAVMFSTLGGATTFPIMTAKIQDSGTIALGRV